MVNENQRIGIVILMTNAYLCLGVRFVKRFMQFYKGNRKIKFFLFADEDPKDYLPEEIDYEYIHTTNKSWVDGTNLKFNSILSLKDRDVDFLLYTDADTNIDKEFVEDWFIGDLVGGQHYADQSWMKDKKGFDRNPKSKAYIPYNTGLEETYFYGAILAGKKDNVIEMCKTLKEWQDADHQVGYEAPVNDESYIQRYFHFNRPKVIPTSEFQFLISDKGGIGETRNVHLNIEKLKEDLLLYKNRNIDIKHGKVVLDE